MLCLTMLFVSCDQGETVETTVETTEETTEEITTEAVIEDVEIDYSSIIADWNANLEFKDPESTPVLNPNGSSLIATNNALDNVEIKTAGSFILVTTVFDNYDYYWGNEASRSVRYDVYSANTGALLRTFSVPEYYVESGYARLTFSFQLFNGIFEVTQGTVTRNIVEETDSEGNSISSYYEYDTTYSVSYYNHKGDALATNLEQGQLNIKYFDNNDDALFYIEDKCYLVRNEEVFYTFNKGQERPLPRVALEYLNYKYSFENGTFRVFDEAYNLIAAYTNHFSYDEIDNYVLNNGNVFTQYIYYLSEDAKDYDFETVDGQKFNVSHVLLDVTTGKATELDLGYVIYSLVTNAYSTANMTVKNNNHFAEVYKITDGKMATDCSFLILDNSLKEVKELPRILKNQTPGTEFLNNGDLLIAMEVYEEVFYTVDMLNNKVELYVDVNGRYREFGDYFIYNNVIYTEDFIELYDLSVHSNYTINGDSVLIYDSYDNGYGENTVTYSVLTISEYGCNTYDICSYTNPSNYFSVTYSEVLSCYMVRELSYYNDETISLSFFNSKGESIGKGAETTAVLGSSDAGVTIRFRFHNWDGFNDYYYFFKY